MPDVSVQPVIVQPTRASFQRGAGQLERLNLIVQRKQQIVIAHGTYVFWQPMMLLYRSKFSPLSIGERFPWCKSFGANLLGVTKQQILFKCCGHYFFGKQINRYARILALKFGFVFTNKSVEFRRIVHLLIFSHAAFLLLVDGVATNTLAGFGVACYFGGAV